MNLRKRLTYLIFSVVLSIGAITPKISACSCDTISFDRAVNYADEIFVGKVFKAEKIENGKFKNSNGKKEINWIWSYHFNVKEKWKGNNKSTLIVYHQGTSCDYYFDIYEDEYLVFASRKSEKEDPFGVTILANNNKKELSTWLCSRTIYNHSWDELNWFDKDIERLNQLFPNQIQFVKKGINKNWFILGGSLILIISIIFKLKWK